MRYLLLLLIATVAFAGDATNPVVKAAQDTYESDVSKAYADYIKAITKVNEKNLKDLDAKFKAAMKKGDLDLANAIKKQIEQINAGETLADLENKWKGDLGKSLLPGSNTDPIVGKWKRDDMDINYVFAADGTVSLVGQNIANISMVGVTGTWKFRPGKNGAIENATVTIKWSRKDLTETIGTFVDKDVFTMGARKAVRVEE